MGAFDDEAGPPVGPALSLPWPRDAPSESGKDMMSLWGGGGGRGCDHPHTGRCSGAPAGRMTESSWEVTSPGCQQENRKTANF